VGRFRRDDFRSRRSLEQRGEPKLEEPSHHEKESFSGLIRERNRNPTFLIHERGRREVFPDLVRIAQQRRSGGALDRENKKGGKEKEIKGDKMALSASTLGSYKTKSLKK